MRDEKWWQVAKYKRQNAAGSEIADLRAARSKSRFAWAAHFLLRTADGGKILLPVFGNEDRLEVESEFNTQPSPFPI